MHHRWRRYASQVDTLCITGGYVMHHRWRRYASQVETVCITGGDVYGVRLPILSLYPLLGGMVLGGERGLT